MLHANNHVKRSKLIIMSDSRTNTASIPTTGPRFSSSIFIAIGIVLVILLTHRPNSEFTYKSDDYLQVFGIAGNAQLEDAGFKTAAHQSWISQLSYAFHFFNHDLKSLQPQRDYGNIPWWGSEAGKMHPFRPLAGLTHWLDYQVFDLDIVGIQWHSLAYFLLFALISWGFYQKWLCHTSLALLCTALLIFDMSMTTNWQWIAARNAYLSLGLGIGSLLCYENWRSSQNYLSAASSVVLFLLSVLAAEAAVALLGYFGAYALTQDKKGWLKGCLAVIPFIVVVILWRSYYNAYGFGSTDIGLYVDPGRDPIAFTVQLVKTYPIICLSLISGVDGVISALSLQTRAWIYCGAWALMVLFLLMIKNLIKRDKSVQYMLLGSMISVIPYATSFNPSARSTTFVSLGFFYVLTKWLWHELLHERGAARKIAGGAILLVFLFIPVLTSLANAWNALPVHYVDDRFYSNIAPALQENPDRSLVVINHGNPSQLYYLPYSWAFTDKILPQRIQSLAPGLSTFKIRRISGTQYQITSPNGLVLNQNDSMVPINTPAEPAFSIKYAYRLSQGLFTDPNTIWPRGKVAHGAGMRVEINRDAEGQATVLTVEFTDSESADNKLWQWYNWADRKYYLMEPLAIGEEREFSGPMDVAADKTPDGVSISI
jgi:hypothetical protein